MDLVSDNFPDKKNVTKQETAAIPPKEADKMLIRSRTNTVPSLSAVKPKTELIMNLDFAHISRFNKK